MDLEFVTLSLTPLLIGTCGRCSDRADPALGQD